VRRQRDRRADPREGVGGIEAFGDCADLDRVGVAVELALADAAKIEIVSRLRQAGTMPVALIRPGVGLTPTMLLSAAGTRPEPAVSVPSAKAARPAATATPEPELEPPEM
jgi:hypothetical protein